MPQQRERLKRLVDRLHHQLEEKSRPQVHREVPQSPFQQNQAKQRQQLQAVPLQPQSNEIDN